MNTKIQNYIIFTLFPRKEFLGCYKSTPLKMNLILEIRKGHGFPKRDRNKIFKYSFIFTTCIPQENTYVS